MGFNLLLVLSLVATVIGFFVGLNCGKKGVIIFIISWLIVGISTAMLT